MVVRRLVLGRAGNLGGNMAAGFYHLTPVTSTHFSHGQLSTYVQGALKHLWGTSIGSFMVSE